MKLTCTNNGGAGVIASCVTHASLLFCMGLLAPKPAQAQTTLSGDHIVTGHVDVGTTGTNKNLTVTGTAKLEGKVGVGVAAPGARVHVATGIASAKGLILQGVASQSANLQEWQDSGGAIFGSLDALGNFTLNATPDPTVKILSKQTGAGAGAYYYAGRFETDPGGSALARANGLYASATGYNNTSDSVTAVEGRGWSVGASGTLPKLIGVSGAAYHYGTGLRINHAYGMQARAGFYNATKTGTIANAYGLHIMAGGPLEAGQTITTATGLNVDLGAATNGYGIFVNNFNTNPSGDNYGVYIAGGTNNYFEGKVGIGNPNPGAKLDVNGDLKVAGTISIGSGTTAITLNPTTSQITVGGQAFLAPASDGNVGIGTSSSSAKLQVVTTVSGSDNANNAAIFESTGGSGIVTIRSSSTSNFAALNGSLGTDLVGAIDFRPTTGDLTFWSNPIGSNSWTERMRIRNSDGNVGIGSQPSTAKLQVSTSQHGSGSTNNIALFQSTSGAGIVTVRSGTSNQFAAYYGSLGTDIVGAVDFRPTSGDLTFWSNSVGGDVWTERMRVKNSNGNVGIGTTDPQASLHVGGSVQFDGSVKMARQGDILMGEFGEEE